MKYEYSSVIPYLSQVIKIDKLHLSLSHHLNEINADLSH